MITRTLTGRLRYRTQCRSWWSHSQPLVVLQVQVHAKGFRVDEYGFTEDVDELYWRDATVGDVTHFTSTKWDKVNNG